MNLIFLQTMNKMNNLIIFIKNPILGKVKTRLAAAMGNQKALEVYEYMLEHTRDITSDVSFNKFLYYSDFIDAEDDWSNEKYEKCLQAQTSDLGQKMASAFGDMLERGASKAIIIGSDCLELTSDILNEAYIVLNDCDVVIGPSHDGGYYLIGLNYENIALEARDIIEQLFYDKQWSHSGVYREAVKTLIELKLVYYNLRVLNDIDDETDWEDWECEC